MGALMVVLKDLEGSDEAVLRPLAFLFSAVVDPVTKALDRKDHLSEFREPRVVVLQAGKSTLDVDAAGERRVWRREAHNQWRRGETERRL